MSRSTLRIAFEHPNEKNLNFDLMTPSQWSGGGGGGGGGGGKR